MNSCTVIAAAALLTVPLMLQPSISAFQEEVTLRYRFIKGETLRYRITQETTSTVSGSPMGDISADQTMTQSFRAVVEDVAPDGTTTLTQIVDAVRMEMSSPIGKIIFDSASPEPGGDPGTAAMNGVLTAMIGEPFTLVLSPTGAVKKVEGFTRIAEKIFKNLPQNSSSAQMQAGFKAMFSDESMLNMMAQGFTQFAERRLKIGDSWTTQISLQNPAIGGFTISMTSTLSGIDQSAANQIARIVTQLTIKHDGAMSDLAKQAGMGIEMGASTGTAEIAFDVTNGRLLRSTTRATMSATMTRTRGADPSMTMKMLIKNFTTVELIQ